MKENWTYKKLGDVCQVVTGSTPKTNIPEYWSGKYPWITPAELKGDTYIRDTERHITDKAVAHTNLTLMPIGTVLLSSRAPIGKVAITETEMYCNQGFKNLICSDEINNKYLFLWLKGQTDYLNSLGRGATFKEISKNIVENIQIPLPPLSIQQSIVAELDEINNLLQLKKKELETFDKLAQSIFYEMFGDPVTNEKGWEVKKFADIFKLKSGDGLSAKEFKDGDIPVYGGNGISGYHDTYNMNGKFIIIGRVGVYCGNVREVKGKFWLTDNAFQLFYDEQSQDSCFVHYLLELLNLRNYANAAAQPVISNLTLKGVEIILPPLSIQQTFATRIEAIEHQKSQVKSSIEKLETLLASRMQYWFD